MEKTYGKAWKKQGIQRTYSFSDEQRKRIEFAI
jgi:hypothetical protein